MAKSSRSSVTKRNNKNLKRTVFGPAETARNDRLNAKLLALAQQPKPPRTEMDLEPTEAQDAAEEAKENNEDIDMDADTTSTKRQVRSNNSLKREKINKAARVDKKKVVRKQRNQMTFKKHPKKARGGKKS